MLAAKQWLTFTSGSPLQPAVALALDEEPDFPRALARDLQERRDLLVDGLARGRAHGVRPRRAPTSPPPRCASSAGRTGWPSAGRCPERAGVVAIPTQVFYDDQADPDGGRDLVRFAFCKTREVIEDGVARLAEADLSA